MSSDIMSRVINVNDFGLTYAGAQKNLGPSGVALVIIRKDLMERVQATVPTMLRYTTYFENGSMFNTPPTYSVYMLALVTDYFKELGGIAAIEKINEKKAAMLYDYLDSTSFYNTPVQKDSRSLMNVVFRTPSDELDAKFVAEARANGLTDLKGHRLVGGCRASIYNAMPVEGVEALIKFMKEFEKAN
jgi:phosphoserine aminotransferase